MRLFAAAVPPADVLAPLAALVPSWRERWPNVGWIPPERWHLTLCFFGEVGDPSALSVRVGAAASPFRRIDAAVGGGGTFPGGRRPRVAWVGVEAGPELAELAAAVTAGAAAAGVATDGRPYRPHITLGRVRRPPVVDPDGLRDALGVAAGRAFTIDQVVLFRSHLGPQPRYEEIGLWPLAGDQP